MSDNPLFRPDDPRVTAELVTVVKVLVAKEVEGDPSKMDLMALNYDLTSKEAIGVNSDTASLPDFIHQVNEDMSALMMTWVKSQKGAKFSEQQLFVYFLKELQKQPIELLHNMLAAFLVEGVVQEHLDELR